MSQSENLSYDPSTTYGELIESGTAAQSASEDGVALEEVLVALESLCVTLESTQVIDHHSAVFVTHTVNSFNRQAGLGLESETLSPEGLTVSVESAIANFFKAVLHGIKKAWEAVLNFFRKLFGFSKSRVEADEKKIQTIKEVSDGKDSHSAILNAKVDDVEGVPISPQLARALMRGTDKKIDLEKTVQVGENKVVDASPAVVKELLEFHHLGPLKQSLAAWLEITKIPAKSITTAWGKSYVLSFVELVDLRKELDNSTIQFFKIVKKTVSDISDIVTRQGSKDMSDDDVKKLVADIDEVWVNSILSMDGFLVNLNGIVRYDKDPKGIQTRNEFSTMHQIVIKGVELDKLVQKYDLVKPGDRVTQLLSTDPVKAIPGIFEKALSSLSKDPKNEGSNAISRKLNQVSTSLAIHINTLTNSSGFLVNGISKLVDLQLMVANTQNMIKK